MNEIVDRHTKEDKVNDVRQNIVNKKDTRKKEQVFVQKCYMSVNFKLVM